MEPHRSQESLTESAAPVNLFLELPRELRDQIYNEVFHIGDRRTDFELRIVRRSVGRLKASAATILLTLHHECLLLNRQIACEALEVLFKKHPVYLNCGPRVLKAFLEKIERLDRGGGQWLKWLKSIQLEWLTFPNLKCYEKQRNAPKWSFWEYDKEEIDVDYVQGGPNDGCYNYCDNGSDDYGHGGDDYDHGDYDYSHEGRYHDDDFYNAAESSVYTSFESRVGTQASSGNDPFGFDSHYPFTDPAHDPVTETSTDRNTMALNLLVSQEVLPLFKYLASPIFNLTSITIPLYFISKEAQGAYREAVTEGRYFKRRYWTYICIHALLILIAPRELGIADTSPMPSLKQVHINYVPKDVWASMNPADDLQRMREEGVWYEDPEDGEGGASEHDGLAFKAIWTGLSMILPDAGPLPSKWGLNAQVTYVPWNGDASVTRCGDELEIVFTKAIDQPLQQSGHAMNHGNEADINLDLHRLSLSS